MRFLHGRWRRRVSLLASGALEGPEKDSTLRHLEGCGPCRGEVAEIQALLAAVPTEAVRSATPGVPLDFLVARVKARLDAAPSRSARVGRWAWAGPLVAAGAVAAVVLVLRPSPTGPARPASARQGAVDPERPCVASSETSLGNRRCGS